MDERNKMHLKQNHILLYFYSSSSEIDLQDNSFLLYYKHYQQIG